MTFFSNSSSLYTSTAQSGPSGPLLLMHHSRPSLFLKPDIIPLPLTSYLLPLAPHHRLMFRLFLYTSCFLFLLDSIRVLQYNVGGLRVRRTELLHFVSSHPVDLICIQQSNLNSFSFFWIPGFSALRCDRTYSRPGIFSTGVTHPSGGIIIFVRQGLSFSELSISSLSSLDPYSDYVEVNVSLNDFSSLSFLNVYAPPIRSSPRDNKTDSFFPPIFQSLEISSFWGTDYHHFLWDFKGTSDPRVEEVFDWIISSDLLNDSNIPTLFYRSSAVAPLLTSLLLLSLLPSFAPGRCFKTCVLITYQFYNNINVFHHLDESMTSRLWNWGEGVGTALKWFLCNI